MAPGLHGCAPADPLPLWPSPGQGPRELPAQAAGLGLLRWTWTVGTVTSGAGGWGGRGSLVAQSPSAGKGVGEGCWPQGGPVGAVAREQRIGEGTAEKWTIWGFTSKQEEWKVGSRGFV